MDVGLRARAAAVAFDVAFAVVMGCSGSSPLFVLLLLVLLVLTVGGTTPGLLFARLRVRRTDGRRAGFVRDVVRGLLTWWFLGMWGALGVTAWLAATGGLPLAGMLVPGAAVLSQVAAVALTGRGPADLLLGTRLVHAAPGGDEDLGLPIRVQRSTMALHPPDPDPEAGRDVTE